MGNGKGLRGTDFASWHEALDDSGQPREVYRPLFDRLERLPRPQVRGLDERLEATMREMGVTFDIGRDRAWGRRPWYCDLLPQIFTPEEWDPLVAGIRQRLRAFELFLRDIYTEKKILRQGEIPIQPVLGSPYYQRAASSLTPPGGAYLHLSGLCVCRTPDGRFAVKQHYFSNASGISYMIQNRRALARVIPQSFHDCSIHSISDTPVDILEVLRSFSNDSDPTVVLLSSGPGSAVYSEHSFLARRMGIPLVQGGDLLVLNDAVYLKTVSGLEKVEVIYSRISDQWLDPMVFRRDSLLGVPGLIHCIRKGTVAVVNGIGSQLADDRSLLPLAPAIIRHYLGEKPMLRSLPTFWLGDIDQREMVLENLENYTIRPLYGEKILLGGDGRIPSPEQVEVARKEILDGASQYVAQSQQCDADTVTFQMGRKSQRRQDHIIFALRRPDGEYDIFPGALTRVSTADSPFTSSELGGGSKDTWVQARWSGIDSVTEKNRPHETLLPSQIVTSRVAEAFYWIGRYLERAQNLAGVISVIEALEMEELNPTERMLYRPVWNRVLPPLENPAAGQRRNISSAVGRYRLTIDYKESESIVSTILRASSNAESILECLSLEAWSVLSELRAAFQKAKFRPESAEESLTATTRKLCEQASRGVPQFFGIAESTMIADGGWRFCEIGQFVERAITTANAACSIIQSPVKTTTGVESDHAAEIRLSAFLRLLNSRDVYRRVYQMRIEPGPMLDLLWKNPVVPRSVTRCMGRCATHIAVSHDTGSPATARTLVGIEHLLQEIRQTDWISLLGTTNEENPKKSPLALECQNLLSQTLNIHHMISDGFLNHQIHMRHDIQPLLLGLKNAL